MKRLLLILTVILAVLLGSAFSQPTSDRKVNVEAMLSSDAIPAGGSVQLAVIIKINKGWHINSHTPSEGMIPTLLALTPREGVIISDIRYPKGGQVKLDFSDQPLDVYEGTITVFATLKVSERVALGSDTIRGTLDIQACDSQMCFAPATISIAVPTAFTAVGQSVAPLHKEIFASYKPSELVIGAGRNELAATFEEKGSLVFFLAIFLVGLALNLTPCVYPMLSVTVSLFGGQSETHVGRVFFKAVVYVLGIASMYSVLGVTAALGGGLFGSWLQSPWVLGGIAALLFGLALSSFGVYQIQIPYWLTRRLGGSTGTGYVGIYLSGLVVGVFAAPCVGPPVIALLTFVGAKGDPVFGFWSFFMLSLGLGFPYLILGTFSGLLKKVPRSGTWLIWVEHVFGVVLLGAALFYLALAVTPKLSPYVIPLVLIIGGVFLGFIDASGRDSKVLRNIQWVFGALTIALGLSMADGMREPGIAWDAYVEHKVQNAKENGQPVLLDFYADWCIPCLELDRNTWTDAEVVKATKDWVRLKVDLTHFDSPESESIRKQFNIGGVPTVIFLRPDGSEAIDQRIVGFVPPKQFLAILKTTF